MSPIDKERRTDSPLGSLGQAGKKSGARNSRGGGGKMITSEQMEELEKRVRTMNTDIKSAHTKIQFLIDQQNEDPSFEEKQTEVKPD